MDRDIRDVDKDGWDMDGWGSGEGGFSSGSPRAVRALLEGSRGA